MGPAKKMTIGHLVINYRPREAALRRFGANRSGSHESRRKRNAYAWNGCGLSGVGKFLEVRAKQLGEHCSAEAKIASSHPVNVNEYARQR